MACCTIPMDPRNKDYTPKAHSSLSTAALIFSILFCTLPVGLFLAVTDLRKKSINYDHSCSVLALCTIPIHILVALMLANTYFSNPYHATALTDAFISYNENRSGAEKALSGLPIASPGDTFDTGALLITLNDYDMDFTDYTAPYSSMIPEDGWKYLMVDVTYTNYSSSHHEVHRSDLKCYVNYLFSMADYDLDQNPVFTLGYSNPPDLWPGATLNFRIYYQIPTVTESVDLEYKYNGSSQKGYIRLQ